MSPPSWFLGTAFVLGGAAYLLYQYYLHPAWRRQRRIVRACRKAFEGNDYRLVRIHLGPDGPSGTDLFSSSPSGSSISRRYFTYRIEADEDPDFSSLTRKEANLVRHYINRTERSPHYGETVLLPEQTNTPVGGMSPR